jgi:predicted DNA-binding transcriptional regulator YafY
VNRTDRLYALVEELRAVSPRPRSAHWLAGRFEVDARTIRRDISALQQAGVPIYAEAGRRGGYVVDRTHTLPPVNITPREAVATAIALEALADAPFLDAARSALRKLVAAMPPRDVEAAREVAGRIHLAMLPPGEDPGPPPPRHVLRVAEDAVVSRAVLAIDYVDRHGAASRRLVEPVALLGGGRLWYLVGWCRLRGGEREFRLDRMRRAATTDETAPSRSIDPNRLRTTHLSVSRLEL